jgi:hypothetical protein
MLSPSGVGMLLSRIVPSARIVSIRVVSNVRPINSPKDKLARSLGAGVIMPIILIVSPDGPVKRKIPVHFAKKIGLPSKLLNNDFLKLEI